MDFLSLIAPKSDASGGGAIFSLPWGASGDSEPVRDAESTSSRSERDDAASQASGASRRSRGSAKHSVASASQSHRSNSSFFQERSGRANGMGEAARIESTRGMMSAGTEASAPGAAPALGADAGRNGEGLRTKPQGNISHMDLKRRIEENLELLQRHVHEARQEKDELLDEVEHVLQQYKHVALLNKDIAVEQMEEEQATSGRAAELYYKVKQQQRNLLAIDKDVKNMDSALFITNKLKDVSYMTGVSAGMGPRMAQRREELVKNQRQAAEELANLQAELRSMEPATMGHTKMHHTVKLTKDSETT